MSKLYWATLDNEPDITDEEKERFGPIFDLYLSLEPGDQVRALVSLVTTVAMSKDDPFRYGEDFTKRFGAAVARSRSQETEQKPPAPHG